MALVTIVSERLPLNGAVNVSINTVIRSKFVAAYTGEGGWSEMNATAGYASLTVDGNTEWDDLPVEHGPGDGPTCFTPALTLEYDTVYTWYGYATIYTDQPAHGDPFITNVTSSEFTFTTEANPNRQIELSSPTDTDTGITLIPLLEWTIDGAGATEGDLLDVYLKKDDSDFGSADLIGDLLDATLNTDKQIISGLEYNTTYYWQVQAASSTADDLLSSEIYSFTTLVFYPPTPSVDPDDGDIITGMNGMVTLKRLVVAADDKVFYET